MIKNYVEDYLKLLPQDLRFIADEILDKLNKDPNDQRNLFIDSGAKQIKKIIVSSSRKILLEEYLVRSDEYREY